MKPSVLIALALVGCSHSSQGVDDVVGPFTGTNYRYVVDQVTLPSNNSEARSDADDLGGDGMRLNEFGMLTATLASNDDLSTAGAALIASGMIASTVEILADDLTDDPTVQVTYFGTAGDTPVPIGGVMAGGTFRSNRTATTAIPGRASIVLPVFADADPSMFPIDGLEMDLTGDGSGGFTGFVRGGIPAQIALDTAAAGIVQMISTYPTMHLLFAEFVDTNHDGQLSIGEVSTNALIAALLDPDLILYDDGTYMPMPAPNGNGGDSLSIGFAIHLSPCPSGSCAPPQTDACHDRVLDGNETAVDCGGTCQPCPGGVACAVPKDCQTQACDGGACAPATCSDGIVDGLESDVDCGDGCEPCAPGKTCLEDQDCATGHCNGGRCSSP